jgi:hypothetical protein
VPEPILTTLTRIGTVEGFGSMIRHTTIPPFERCFEEEAAGRRDQTLAITLSEVEFALEGHRRRNEILEGFHDRGSLRPGPEGSWIVVPEGN